MSRKAQTLALLYTCSRVQVTNKSETRWGKWKTVCCKAATSVLTVYRTVGAWRCNSERLHAPCEIAVKRLTKINVSGTSL